MSQKLEERFWESLPERVKASYLKAEDSGSIRSTTRHEKPCGNERGPPRKAKYSLVTDRAEYCEGKVKRTPGGEWKRTWNPVFTNCGSTIRVQPRTFCRTVRRVTFTGEVKHLRCGAEGIPSLNRALSQYTQTRNRVIYPCPGWSCRKRQWRTEATSVEKGGHEVWIGEKFQSNPEIAGSPRNSFRASLDLVLWR